ncbi:universal stress protein [Salinigranum sp.]|uniref:universal stress protein n=1 Tax=Salinigranum sp. TaxID=1966351 RepID=UPI003569155E
MGSVLLATDGSEYARTAARRAVEIADERGTPLHVICVVDSQRFAEPALSSTELTTIYAEEHAAVCVGEVEEMTADRDLPVAGDTRHGVPHEVILEYAAEVDADVIVVGEHGDHTRHFSGVGKRVAERADCEVLVVEAES